MISPEIIVRENKMTAQQNIEVENWEKNFSPKTDQGIPPLLTSFCEPIVYFVLDIIDSTISRLAQKFHRTHYNPK